MTLPILEPELPPTEFTLHPGQKRLLEDRWKRRHAIVAGVGYGKRLALDTKIPTPSGMKTMGELRVGDELFDERGAVCRVTNMSPICETGVCYRIVFDDGTAIVADAEHQWVTSTSKQRKNAARRSCMESVHAETRPQCRPSTETSSVVTTEQIRETLTDRLGAKNHSIALCAAVDYAEIISLPVEPYTLGAWLGDGNSSGPGFTTMDREILEHIAGDGYGIGPERKFDETNKASGYTIGYSGGGSKPNPLLEGLRELGLVGNKHIPDLYQLGSVEQRLSLLQGLMDTDGSISCAGRCEFSSKWKHLARQAQVLAHSLGIKTRLSEANSTLKGRVVGRRYRLQFTTDLPVFRLSRKAEKLARASVKRLRDNRYTKRYIASVEPVESVPCRCITVDSPSSLYLVTEAFVPTHNTKFGPNWHFKRCIDNHRSSESLVIAPDNKLLKNRCLAEYENFLVNIGMREGRGRGCDYSIHRSAGDIFINFRWGPRGLNSWSQKVFFLTGESPNKIISYNISHAWLDEPASMEELVDKNVSFRMRCPSAGYRQRLYTGTPEGLNWFYKVFNPAKTPRIEGTLFSENKHNLVLHGRSHDNPYLDEQYLSMLDEEFGWDPQYYANYVLGEWVSMSRNGFYFGFNPADNVIDCPPDPDTDVIYLSFDNNVGQMTFVVIQPFEDRYLVVKDNDGKAHNIDDACHQFVQFFPPEIWGTHSIVVLGDSALHARSVHSFISGYQKIEANLKPMYRRLRIAAPRSNPTFEERSRCTNRLLKDHRLLINRACNKVIESARTAESDTNGKIKKPRGDTWTHAMEAVDMAMIVLEPSRIKRVYQGLK